MESERASAIPAGDRAVYEDEALRGALQYLITEDQITAPSLKGCELIARCVQLNGEAYRMSPALQP